MIHIIVCLQIFCTLNNSVDYLVLSGTNTATSRCINAIHYNPANLSLDRAFSLRIISPSAGVLNSSFSISQYNYYSSGVFLEDKDKRKIMKSIPDKGFTLLTTANISGLELSVGGFGLSISSFAIVKGTVPKEIFDLMLWGNELDRVYEIEKPDMTTVAAISLTTSYGRLINFGGRNISLGVGLRYIYGFYTAHVSEATLYLLTSRYAINGDGFVKYRLASGGNGFALDLGFSAEISDVSRIGFSFLNINTGMKWYKETEEGWRSFDIDSLILFNTEDAITVTDSSSYECPSFKTPLPAYLILAYEYDRGKIKYGIGYEQVINKTGLYSRTPKISFGLKYYFRSYLTPMVGLAFGGDEGLLIGIGSCFSVKKIGLKIGLQNVGIPFMGTKGLKLGIDLGYNI